MADTQNNSSDKSIALPEDRLNDLRNSIERAKTSNIQDINKLLDEYLLILRTPTDNPLTIENYNAAVLAFKGIYAVFHRHHKIMGCNSVENIGAEEKLTEYWPEIWGWCQALVAKDASTAFEMLLLLMHPGSRKNQALCDMPGLLEFVARQWRADVTGENTNAETDSQKSFHVASQVIYFAWASRMPDTQWPESFLKASGLKETEFASIALAHLQPYLRTRRTDDRLLDDCAMDIQIINALAEHIPVRNAMLSQHSIRLVTTLLTFITNRPQVEISQYDGDVLNCLSSGGTFLVRNITALDSITGIVRSLEVGLLPILFKVAGLVAGSPLDQVRNTPESHRAEIVILKNIIPLYLIYFSVLQASYRAIAKVLEANLENTALDEAFGEAWVKFKSLVASRMELLGLTDMPPSICTNVLATLVNVCTLTDCSSLPVQSGRQQRVFYAVQRLFYCPILLTSVPGKTLEGISQNHLQNVAAKLEWLVIPSSFMFTPLNALSLEGKPQGRSRADTLSAEEVARFEIHHRRKEIAEHWRRNPPKHHPLLALNFLNNPTGDLILEEAQSPHLVPEFLDVWNSWVEAHDGRDRSDAEHCIVGLYFPHGEGSFLSRMCIVARGDPTEDRVERLIRGLEVRSQVVCGYLSSAFY